MEDIRIARSNHEGKVKDVKIEWKVPRGMPFEGKKCSVTVSSAVETVEFIFEKFVREHGVQCFIDGGECSLGDFLTRPPPGHIPQPPNVNQRVMDELKAAQARIVGS